MNPKYSKYYSKNKITKTPEKNDLQEAQKLERLIFGLLIAIIAILPLLTRAKIIDFTSPLITTNSTIGSGTVGDVFTYYKFIFLVIATTILLVLFLYRTVGIGIPIKKSFINIPLAVLALTVTLSALFAPNKSLALLGMYNRHEGALTYLSYFTLFFIAANLTYTKKMLYTVIYALYPVTIVNTVLGLLGFYGVELINSRFAQAILLPSGLTKDALGAGSRFITTINHGNYVSGISAVLLVIFMMMFILDKNRVSQVINGLFAFMSFAMMLSSLSRSGFLTFVLTLPVLLIILMRTQEKLKSYAKLTVQLVVFAVIFVVMGTHNPQVWGETMGMFVDKNPFGKEERANQIDAGIKQLAWNNLKIITFESRVFAESNIKESIKEFELPKLPQYGTAPGTGRLYIWDKTIDLIKERPILGYGLDTFIYHFPQNDPGKISGLNSHTVIVDKPHNLYLNMTYGAGVLAAIAFIVLFGSVLLESVRRLFNRNLHVNDSNVIVVFSILVGCIAYLIQGLFNDSVIGSAPIFWIAIGVVLSIIKDIKVDNKEIV